MRLLHLSIQNSEFSILYSPFQNKEWYFRFSYTFLAYFFEVFSHKICAFMIFISVSIFIFKFPQQNINHQKKKKIGDQKLSIELYEVVELQW